MKENEKRYIYLIKFEGIDKKNRKLTTSTYGVCYKRNDLYTAIDKSIQEKLEQFNKEHDATCNVDDLKIFNI